MKIFRPKEIEQIVHSNMSLVDRSPFCLAETCLPEAGINFACAAVFFHANDYTHANAVFLDSEVDTCRLQKHPMPVVRMDHS